MTKGHTRPLHRQHLDMAAIRSAEQQTRMGTGSPTPGPRPMAHLGRQVNNAACSNPNIETQRTELFNLAEFRWQLRKDLGLTPLPPVKPLEAPIHTPKVEYESEEGEFTRIMRFNFDNLFEDDTLVSRRPPSCRHQGQPSPTAGDTVARPPTYLTSHTPMDEPDDVDLIPDDVELIPDEGEAPPADVVAQSALKSRIHWGKEWQKTLESDWLPMFLGIFTGAVIGLGAVWVVAGG